MGARLSQPRGSAGTTEASVPFHPDPPKRPIPRTINRRTIVAPAAAFTMACLLFVYTRTSIRAAKANAQRHRDADSGGEGLSLLAEQRRRHGQAERLDRGGNTVTELAHETRVQLLGRRNGSDVAEKTKNAVTEEEDKLQALKGSVKRKVISEDT